jgi:hypothetical protein
MGKLDEPLGDTTAEDSPTTDIENWTDRATCTFKGKSYGEGARICWGNKIQVCGKNGWIATGEKC